MAESSANPIELVFGKGVANRMPETQVPPGYARAAINVDFSDTGSASRRSGYTKFVSLPGAHSLWTHADLGYMAVADATTLYGLTADGDLTALVTGLNGSEISYCMTPKGVYWANDSRTGCLTFGMEAQSWGVETPNTTFLITPVSGGGLDAGLYGLTVTFISPDGEEGGAPATQYVTVAAGGGIQLSGLPTPQDTSITEIRVYVTSANGTQLFYAGTTLVGASSFLIGQGPRGRELRTQFYQPLPPLKYPVLKAGRLFGAYGDLMVWSDPLYYGLTHYKDNYIKVPDPITMIAAPDSQKFLLYIGTENRTYVLSADSLEDARLAPVAFTGVVPGSMAMVMPDAINIQEVVAPVPVWVDARGVPNAGTEFGVVPVHSRFVYPIYSEAAAAFVQIDGVSRYIVGGRGGAPSGLTMSDRAVARVYDEGGGA